ncbi:putative sensor-like histidine kinase [compost metagenome]
MKMSLQPIIENYIIHGLRTERTDNVVFISIVRKDTGIVQARIEDNGRGISSERLSEITRNMSNPDTYSESFGLRSIHERLKLLYGNPYGIELHSEEGEGTTVIVSFPEQEEANIIV